MELLETQDPEKRKLIETSERHKRELEKEVNEMTAKTQRMVTNALIIGGSLAVSYWLVSRIGRSSSKKKKNLKATIVAEPEEQEETGDEQDEVSNAVSGFLAPTLIAQIGTRVINQATIMLLDIAREKLNEYLTRKPNENS